MIGFNLKRLIGENFCRLLAAAAVVFFHGTAVALSFYLCFFQGNFLKRETFQYKVAEKLGISEGELGRVVEEMMAWLKSPNGDLQVEVTVNQTPVSFFRERDLQHLADIAEMVHRGRIICAVLCPLTAVSVFFLIRKRREKTLCKIYLFSWGILLLTAVGIGVWLLVDLVGFIDTFHRIFFRNGLWILNPATDMLIWLFPASLFRDGAIRLGIALAAVHIPVVSLSVWTLRGKRSEERTKTDLTSMDRTRRKENVRYKRNDFQGK